MSEISRAPVSIRAGTKDDLAFIFNSWLMSFWDAAPSLKHVDRAPFFKHHHSKIEACLARPGVEILVATPEDEPRVIVGYLVLELTPNIIGKPRIHYIYVKAPFREMGIARALLGGFEFQDAVYTHLTFKAERILFPQGKPRPYPSMTYNPYLF